MDQVLPQSPGRIVTLQRERREKCKLLSFFLLFKIPLSNPRLESQAMWAVFVFQALSAPPWPQWQQRLAGTVGQKKLHHKQRCQSQSLKTQTRSFRIKWTECRGEDQGRGKGRRDRKECQKKRKRQKERDCPFNLPPRVSIQAPNSALPERASEGGSPRG